ncbi:DUF3102 domain-containing protein [uncultured Oscillibacter sp.]|uniref:DUF3102 domain-containing protein n=1 Tax=uncultured Oscillibacter sp. TaxID=876091 RepID=UPI0025F5CDB5|nr:DUF3102 domain-containing protein [uncultured Oscillibacter sp.]
MKKAFDISKYAATLNQPAPAETRDIETITTEIIQLKQDAGNAILGIGQRLIEAKAILPRGEWLPWLEERVEFSERSAQNFMRLAREWSNPQALADLGASKALTLLALPPEERETFMAESHLVGGEEKTVVDMTSRELERAIKERDAARQEAEAAKADAQTAEESRAKMESDMKALAEIHRSAQEGEAQAREALARAQAELRELRERPVDVAVEVDQAAVDKARAAAVAEMQVKVDQAEAARKEAEKKRKEAETALSEAKKQAGANAVILSRAERAEAELAEARRQLDAVAKAESASLVNQNGDLAMFNVLFSQTQEQVNKMHGLRLKLGKDDGELDGKLKAAISALADAVRRCAE